MIGHKFVIKSGDFFFRYRNFLFPVVLVVLLLFSRPAYFLGRPDLDRIIVALGIIMAFSGAAFRLLVIGFAYIKRGGKDGKVYADDLVVEGFYAHVRNPMYIGNFLILAGMGIIYGSAWIYFLVIPFFSFVYLSIIVTEENYLRGHFGAQFDAYCLKVNRFFPNFKGIRQSLSKFNYDWRKAIRKDYGTFFGLLAGCQAMTLLKKYYFHGLPAGRDGVLAPGFWFIFIGAGYWFFRYLKKSGRLQSPSFK